MHGTTTKLLSALGPNEQFISDAMNPGIYEAFTTVGNLTAAAGNRSVFRLVFQAVHELPETLAVYPAKLVYKPE